MDDFLEIEIDSTQRLARKRRGWIHFRGFSIRVYRCATLSVAVESRGNRSLPSSPLELAPLWHRRRLNDVNGTRPACGSLTRTIDRSTLERTRECRDFIWPGGTRSFTEFVSRDGSHLCRGVRGRGVEFRRSIVQRWRILATPRFYFCPQPRPRRVVRWLRFNNSSRLPAGTDSSRARLLSSRDLRLGVGAGATGEIWRTIAYFSTDLAEFRDFARIGDLRLYRLSIIFDTVVWLTDGNDYFFPSYF